MLFGGEREGQTLNEMWRFHFGKHHDESNNSNEMSTFFNDFLRFK